MLSTVVWLSHSMRSSYNMSAGKKKKKTLEKWYWWCWVFPGICDFTIAVLDFNDCNISPPWGKKTYPTKYLHLYKYKYKYIYIYI